MLAESRRKLIPYAIAILLSPLGAQDPAPPPPGIQPEAGQSTEAPAAQEPTTQEPAAQEPAAQEPTSALPQSEERVVGSLAPAATSLWLRLDGAPRILSGDRDRRIVQALAELERRNAALAGRLRDVAFELMTFAAAHGFGEEQVAELLSGEVELSLFETGDRTDFLVAIPQGGHTTELRRIFDQHWRPVQPAGEDGAAAGQTKTWTAVDPLPFGDELYVGLEGVMLLMASSPEALALGRSLAAEQGAALAFDEEFRKVLGEPSTSSERKEWLALFVRPRKTTAMLQGPEKQGIHALIAGHAAVGYTSRFVDGRFQESLRLTRESGAGMVESLFGAGGIQPDFLARGRAALPESLRMRLSVPALVQAWRERPEMTDTWTGLADFEKRLANLGQGKSLDEALALWSGDLAWLEGGEIGAKVPDAVDVPAQGAEDGDRDEPVLVFGLVDSFQARALFEQLAKVQTAGEAGQEYLELDWGGQVWRLGFDDHRLYASPSLARMQAARVAMQTATPADVAAPTPFIEGRLSVRSWLRTRDGKGALGLRPLATWFEDPTVMATRSEDRVTIGIDAETGSFPWTLVTVDQVLGRLAARQADRNRDQARSTCEQIQRAGRTFMQLVQKDEDHDGRGEAGTLGELIDARRLQDGRQFRPFGHEVWERSGYRYRVLLPLDIDRREDKFFVLAWPMLAPPGKSTCYLLDEAGRLYAHELLTDLDHDAGPGRGPAGRGAVHRPATPPAGRSRTPRSNGRPSRPGRTRSCRSSTCAPPRRCWTRPPRPRTCSRACACSAHLRHRHPGPRRALPRQPQGPRGRDRAGRPAQGQPPTFEVRRSAARALSLIRDPRGMASSSRPSATPMAACACSRPPGSSATPRRAPSRPRFASPTASCRRARRLLPGRPRRSAASTCPATSTSSSRPRPAASASSRR
ncbi:MAG: hypothetical protein R3F30_05965 [Planctomycetota bacterium]